jgi:hypothetical protein
MEVLAPLVADREPPEVIEPRHRPLDHPAMPPQPRLVLDPLAGDADADTPPRQEAAAAAHVVALVGVHLLRSLSRPPARPRTGGMASITAAKTVASGRLAPVRPAARSSPCRSTARCRLVPAPPRSVGFGPTASPPFWRVGWRYRPRPAASRARRAPPDSRGSPEATPATPRRPASRAVAASRCSRSRSQARGSIFQPQPVFRTKMIPHSAR